ncbi:MAG TPA: chemotaxis protein CheW [Lachnospiraceae bacterium]|nr:chemotaxis protein CheW [Lachnospiraceae bacterium]
METHREKSNLLLVIREQKLRFAIPAENVEEIITVPLITKLPGQPEYIKGIFSYHGNILPVLSLKALGGTSSEEKEEACIVLRTGKYRFSLCVSGAETLKEDSGERMKADESLMGQLSARLDFVIPDDPPLFVLDLNKTYEAVEENINSDSESRT